jgi:hypothetical protein
MTTQKATVIGVFSDINHARAAVDDLKQAGFRDELIGMMTRGADAGPTAVHTSTQDQAKEKTTLPDGRTGSQWEEGAGIGAAAGAVTGTGLGLAVAAGLITGVGPVIFSGTLAAVLASAGTGAVVGTVLGTLVGLGVPEREASYYESEFKSGRTIVTVRADERAPEAWSIFARHGAYDFENRNTSTTGAGITS